jgi:DNA-binding GntR family transcriptional regulator
MSSLLRADEAKLSLPPLSPAEAARSTVSARVYAALRKAIISLRVKPGDVLSEADMARQLGTSRQPVREAFIKLSETGFVEIMPQRGTFVTRISSHEVSNARFLRETIEVALARRACELASARQIARLREIVAAQKAMSHTDDNELFFELDDDFHEAVADGADCGSAWSVLDELKGQMDRVRYMATGDATPMQKLIAQHGAVAEAIASRQPDAAAAAMHQHLSEMLTSLPLLARRHAELFSD